MVLKPKLLSRSALCAAAVILAAVPVFGQANAGKSVFYLGGSFNKAIVENAEQGFFGGDIFAGKMITNSLCLGIGAGYDIVHHYSYTTPSALDAGGGDFSESIAIIPAIIKAKYYFTLGPMFQVYAQAGGGVYNTVAKLGREEGRESIGGVYANATHAGFSVGAGLDYWFLLVNGVGVEFEYSMFYISDEKLLENSGDYISNGQWFKYWSVRVDYGIIKF